MDMAVIEATPRRHDPRCCRGSAISLRDEVLRSVQWNHSSCGDYYAGVRPSAVNTAQPLTVSRICTMMPAINRNRRSQLRDMSRLSGDLQGMDIDS
jgi:hypothetical protein